MAGGIDAAGNVIVPPVELHQIQRIPVQAAQAAVDDALRVLEAQRRQLVQIRDVLGVDLDLLRAAARGALQLGHKFADKVLGAGVDIRAVKGGKAAVHQHMEGPKHIRHVQRAVQAVPLAQLPAAVEDAADPVAGGKLILSVHRNRLPWEASRRCNRRGAAHVWPRG